MHLSTTSQACNIITCQLSMTPISYKYKSNIFVSCEVGSLYSLPVRVDAWDLGPKQFVTIDCSELSYLIFKCNPSIVLLHLRAILAYISNQQLTTGSVITISEKFFLNLSYKQLNSLLAMKFTANLLRSFYFRDTCEYFFVYYFCWIWIVHLRSL